MADEQQKPAPVPDEPPSGPAGDALSRPAGETPSRPAGDTGTAAGQRTGGVATALGPGDESPQRAAGRRRSGPGQDLPVQFARALRAGWARAIGLLASAVMIVAVILAVIFAVHILFAVFGANPDNSIVEFVNRWSARFAWRFTSLFTPHSQKVGALANFGIAAVVYLIVGRVVSGVIRRLA